MVNNDSVGYSICPKQKTQVRDIWGIREIKGKVETEKKLKQRKKWNREIVETEKERSKETNAHLYIKGLRENESREKVNEKSHNHCERKLKQTYR